MIYNLKDVVTGEEAFYKTTLEIKEENNIIIFKFVAENSKYYCSKPKYNGIHSKGDAVEILIGTDPNRKEYYEIEVNPLNDIMLAKMRYLGITKKNKAKLKIKFIRKKYCFVYSFVERNEKGYVAIIRIEKDKLDLNLGEIYFNAYRLETDGGEMEKYLFALNPTFYPKFHVPEKFVLLKDYI